MSDEAAAPDPATPDVENVETPARARAFYDPNRIYKFTVSKRKFFVELIAQGEGRGAAARQCGVNIKTVERHIIADETFAESVDWAEREPTGEVESALWLAAKSGDVRAIQMWLYNRAPDRWADKHKEEIRLIVDEVALDQVARIIADNVQDQPTLDRIRAGLARLGFAGAAPEDGPPAD